MSRASKGRNKEYKVRDIFAERGFMMIRSAASKGPFDLVALPCLPSPQPTPTGGSVGSSGEQDTKTYLIQVKYRDISNAERREFFRLRELLPKHFVLEFWVVKDREKPRCQLSLD